MAKFAKKIKEVDRKVQNCNLAKIESDRELVGLVNRYRTNLELQLREKHNILFSQRGTLVKQADFLQATINKLDSVLKSHSQVEVLQSDEKVIHILKQVEQVILHNPGDEVSVDMTFEKDFLPSYDLYRFNIPRFSQLLEMGIFESNLVSQGGLVWRLRASIEGKTEKCSGHLALFIHLLQGDPQPSRYYIRVEMKHPTRPDSVIREFPFDLKAGDARGFRQFCRIQTLVAKGFVDPSGSYPQLICGIRPLSYRQRSRDQRRYILELESQLAQHKAASTTILAETPDTDTDDAYGEELVGSSDAMLVVSPVTDQGPSVSLLRDDSSQQDVGPSNPARPVSPFDCDFHQAPQPNIPPPLRSAKIPLSRGEMHRRRTSRSGGIPHSENSSDSEYDEDMDQCSAIPSFTSTDELRQLIHQEFDTWSGNLSALAPCPVIRSRILNSSSHSDSASSGLSSSCPTPGQPPLASPVIIDAEPTRSRHRSHSAATYYAFNSPSRSSFSVYAAPSSPSSSEI
ncbi:Tripartite motif containing 37 [Entomophthora muscae]|uniref:Tripartite motif containing 37 n=2 Tax=Entomophthora muscae TaxID=34485 RepID=A0ACC2UGU6_9FUNG|nr:Tripartite motif containing 37 [Entomophthora muscae]